MIRVMSEARWREIEDALFKARAENGLLHRENEQLQAELANEREGRRRDASQAEERLRGMREQIHGPKAGDEKRIKSDLGGMTPASPPWQAISLVIEWERRMAHAEVHLGRFATDREFWVALGQERGIEQLQLRLLGLMAEVHGKGEVGG